MVLSASTVVSYRGTGSSYTLFFRQLMFAVLGVAAMMLMSRMPVAFFRRVAPLLMIVAFAALLLVLVPGIGVEVNGQRNWINLGGPFRLQPSEFAKFALIVWTANLIARRREMVDGWRSLLIPLAPVAGSMILLILLEGDLGTTLVMMPAVAAILLVAGAPMKLFAWMGVAVGSMILFMSITTPYRLQRFATWLDPAADPDGAGWQVLHGQYALATGGWWGVGLGASREKWGFLPEAQTDFILAVIGEELGLVGTLSVLALFAMIAYVIWQIASKADTDFVRLATVGIGIWIVAQALINVGAVVGALPITGLPLPLVSYGGSSLTFTMMAIGMLLAFARNQPAAREFLDNRKAAKRGGRSRPRRLSRRGRRPQGESGRMTRRTTDRQVRLDDEGSKRSDRRAKRKTAKSEPISQRRRRTKEATKRERSVRRFRPEPKSASTSKER
ncbi:MAG: putative lipid II flippase FtsW [Actinobacteria bacterium]|nr:putative lipid II flippase FtsW [Actinomycetota bacterium]